MKKFLSKFFKNKEEVNTPLNFLTLNAIYDYLFYENSSVKFKMKEIEDYIYINRYSFPSSFNHPKGIQEIKGCGYSNAYEVLNALYSKMDISPVEQNVIDEDLEFDCIQLQFYSKASSFNPNLKRVLQNFFIFFCCDNESETINGFRLMYVSNRYFTNFTRSLLETEYFDFNVEKTGLEAVALQDLQKVIIGLCQHLDISVPASLSSQNFSIEKPTVSHIEEFFKLITRNSISSQELKNISNDLFSQLQEQNDDYDFIEDSLEFCENLNFWNSDWKFDPEDAAYFISEILDQDFNFEYPENIYSDDLFPYLQIELAKQDLELMTFETNSDSYLFFVANKNEVDRILELSQIIDIGVEKL